MSDLRRVTFAVLLLDALAWAALALATFRSGSDPATAGLDYAAGIAVTALFALTSLPAVLLVALRRAPRSALAFALAFPAVLALLLAFAWIVMHR